MLGICPCDGHQDNVGDRCLPARSLNANAAKTRLVRAEVCLFELTRQGAIHDVTGDGNPLLTLLDHETNVQSRSDETECFGNGTLSQMSVHACP